MTHPEIDDRLTLPLGRDASAAAREAVRRLGGRVPDRVLADIVLAASELATNAVLHAPPDPPPTLEIWTAGELLCLAVTSAPVPFARPFRCADPGARGGYGLHVVDAVSTRWWVEDTSSNRVVCEFALERTAPVAL